MISEQDFERLSAYIDNQLSPAEKSALDARLSREPELRATLLELRRQVRALRDLPRLKPPRSFTLTPAQAQALRRPAPGLPSFFPALRLATSLSAVAFAILTGLSVMSPAARPLALAPAAAPEAARQTAADAGGAALAETDMAPLAAPAPGVEMGQASGTETGADAPTQEVFSITGFATPEATAPAVSAGAAEEATVIADAPPSAAKAGGEADAASAAVDQAPAPAGPTPLQWGAMGLGVLTLVLAALTWLARRQ